MVTARIDPATGLLSPAEATDGLDEVFLPGTEPRQTATAADGGTDVGTVGDATPGEDVTPTESPASTGPGASPGESPGEVPGAPLVLPVQSVPVEVPDATGPDV